MPTIVCLASYFKGNDFIRECKRLGCHVVLVIKEKLQGEDWPRESLDELIVLPDGSGQDELIDAVCRVGRVRRIDRVVALEEYDVLAAASVREHLLTTGMGTSAARMFRDKLAMRVHARAAGIPVPEFVHALHDDAVRAFIEATPAPWVMKPRSDVSAIGIQVLRSVPEVWTAIEAANQRGAPRERASYYLLERFVSGAVYHVDSLSSAGRVLFAGANRYAKPPMEIAHKGGVFITHTVEHGSADEEALFVTNQAVLTALGLQSGAAHAEFIKSDADGRFYFLEVAARVGGAYIAEVLEAASGLNIWREWARLETATVDRQYGASAPRGDYAGIALSLARQEWPDTSAYTDSEIVYRVKKLHHVGLIVSSSDYGRVRELLDTYARRFSEDFAAVLPPLARPE